MIVRGLPAKRYIKIYADAISKILNTKETIEQPKVETTTKEEKEEKPTSKRVSRKDQLADYINSLDFNANTKDTLFKWIFNIGLPKGITLEQLKDKLMKLDEECSGDETLMSKSIENAYLNNYFGFFKPNNMMNKSKSTNSSVEEDSDTTKSGKNRFVPISYDVVF